MPDVAIIGAGQSPYGTRPEPLKALWAQAADAAWESVDRGIDAAIVDEAWIGTTGFGGAQLGNMAALLMEHSGMTGAAAHRVENACASSGFAIRNAWMAVASGQVEVAVAGGIEKMNDLSSTRKRFWLGVSGDTEWERLAGLTFPGTYALMARRWMHEHGRTHDDLVEVAVKNHGHAVDNPDAHLRQPVDAAKAAAARTIADPLTLYDCCPTSDGAAVVVFASGDRASEFTDDPIWVRGSAAASDHLALHDRPSLTRLPATEVAGRRAMSMAGVTTSDLDLVELHDCFTIAELLALEDLEIVSRGEAGAFAAEGRGVRNQGELTVNGSGGLKAKGHPLGATGAGQVVEVVKQLRGQAGVRQVDDAATSLVHNVGGSGATCAVHVLGRDRS